MKSQPTRGERILDLLAGWTYVVLFPLTFLGAWLLQGKPEGMLRWLNSWRFLLAFCFGLQLLALLATLRRRGILPTILVFIGGISLLGFFIFSQVWLLSVSVVASSAGAICAVWPQIRNVFNRLHRSYRELAQSAKE